MENTSMDEKTPIKSEIINNVRNLSISRRGGVRTRGGRLPPINIRMPSKKKVIVPKIPPRPRVIKTEIDAVEQPIVKTENCFENTRGKGRDRQQRVYLQTEGSFLAQGPAARMKRDPAYNDGSSIARVSRNSAKGISEKNIDADALKDLMESFVAGEEYENDNEGKPPIRLPFQKNKTTCRIKLESDSDCKTKIKKEVIEDFETGIKKEIKTEKDEDFALAEDCVKKEAESEKLSADHFLNAKAEKDEDFALAEDCVKKETESEKLSADHFLNAKAEKDEDSALAEDCVKKEIESEKPSADYFLNAKDDSPMILLQLPLLSNTLKTDDHEKGAKERDKGAKEKDNQLANDNGLNASKFIDNFEEGFIGKLKIMKSGRMKLVMGSVEFELLDGTSSETYQEAVCIRIGDKEADLAILGKIEKKLILCPAISELLAENVKSNRTLNLKEV